MQTLQIPDDINNLPLSINEKVALATLLERPRISNGSLARILGLSDSGVRTILRRLKKQKFLCELRWEGSREFRVLVGTDATEPTGCQIVTKNGAVEIRHKMTPHSDVATTPKEREVAALRKAMETLQFIAESVYDLSDARMSSFYANELNKVIEQVKRDVPEPGRTRVLVILERKRNAFATIGYAIQYVPKSQHKQAAALLNQATPEQLAEFYERIQAAQLAGPESPKVPLHLDVGEVNRDK